MTKKGVLALAILMTIMPWVPAVGEAWAETAQTYDGTSSEEQRKGLDYVNRIRKGMGLTELALDPSLAEAAVRHARYADAHFNRDDRRDFSAEEPGKAHYSGTTPEERAAAAGYKGEADIRETIILENEAYDEFDLAENMRVMSLFHDSREIMTNPSATAVGNARVGKATVMVGAVQSPESDSPVRVGIYPYDGMTEAMIGFYEPQDDSDFTGMTITVHADREGVDDIRATLERQAGEKRIVIPLSAKKMEYGDGYVLTATRMLRGDAEYTANVSLRVGGERIEKEWTFRTVAFTYDLYIDDVGVHSPPFYTVDGRVTAPMRFLFERFGARVDWNVETQTITAHKDGLNLSMTIGSDTAYVNGEAVRLDRPPYLSIYTTYVPLRFVSETFGYEVVYNEADRSVEVWTGELDEASID
ncbi:stalk domain-containing protein [Paenibacillus sp.]|uniref:stalk domain-containing protein n=1 Tax=Paenibacillus sp. TaxID=58172 RepID=UPI002D445C2A|nr:stalk domain-containing protein [Paenibacillus sp.]HZG85785.1 stalk domain-containing protein [Paenibacillus sp.]